MEYLVSPGDAALSPAEAKKLLGRISKYEGFEVAEVQAFWMHYTHLKSSDAGAAKVSCFVSKCQVCLLFGLIVDSTYRERQISQLQSDHSDHRVEWVTFHVFYLRLYLHVIEFPEQIAS